VTYLDARSLWIRQLGHRLGMIGDDQPRERRRERYPCGH